MRSSALLLSLALLCASRMTTGEPCASVAGYSFYRMQDALGAYSIKALDPATATTPAAIAAQCSRTDRCNAFTTSGELQIVPIIPAFSVLDGSAADAKHCDGVYVAIGKSLSGANVPADVTPAKLREAGNKQLKNLRAAVAAAKAVSDQLIKQGFDPRQADKLSRDVLRKAFTDAKTPQAQSSDALGSYTYAGVLAAITYPVWDSRAANGTSYSYISPVKYQGGCGSCVAFAATSIAEAAVAAANGTLVNTNDYSEQWLFFCNGLYAVECLTGWTITQAIDVIARYGLPSESNYPYTEKPDCNLASAPDRRPAGNFSSLYINDIAQAKQHIRTHGSVATYFTVYNDFINWNNTRPPYVWDGVSAQAGYHEVTVVGYNDTGSYWIVKNSWGTWWGDAGYVLMAYANGCGLMSGYSDNIMGLTFTRSTDPLPTEDPFSSSPSPAMPCGDGTCGADETCSSCPQDCGNCTRCGDGTCSGGETCLTCLEDCGTLVPTGLRTCCGDGVCAGNAGGEYYTSCPSDCPAPCNSNQICEWEAGERCSGASSPGGGCSDCGVCGSGNGFCGDGVCNAKKNVYTETCSSCSKDCGKCTDPTYCGDGVCTPDRPESSTTCARDCGTRRVKSVLPGTKDGATTTGNGNGNGNGKRRSLRTAPWNLTPRR
ncbi:hypothetical protein GPECTOR_11g198 [Gonium pectorale]|uniref:Peptidase C1A papain C-terminal domain-containing protein n=1 Tax=Gonium pectorale TaxID=33097 RepID=A0A150GPT7_GONPE|nr:hypothetical protein GPECTOR_11g198 [Gonium pectorale]|eukprot:KXZ51752.1 hypothetical protein GPECTOR_11g198 [Gonium pectorale]